VRADSLLRGVLGLVKTVVEDVWFDGAGQQVVVSVRPVAREQRRCGLCGRRCPRYDRGRAVRRRWRGLDLAAAVTWLEAEVVRVRCRVHGVVVARVPWARHGARHTRAFDEQVAWLAVKTSKSAVCELMRVQWRTVGAIIARVVADLDAVTDRFEGLARIGIDEISYRRGQLFLVVVVDHDSGRLVWAAPGRSEATVQSFFAALGPDRCANITHVSADGASYIANAVTKNCPGAVQGVDPFHVVKWANKALTEVRAQAWREARAAAATEHKQAHGRPRKDAVVPDRSASERTRLLKITRYALWKNPENLTVRQKTQLEWIQANDPTLYRAWQLKENLRLIFKLPTDQAATALDHWINTARRCRIPAFVKLQRSITTYKNAILISISHRLSNGRTESVNTKIRLYTRIAFGFHGPEPLIALAILALGGNPPTLPNRT
jgi:transposase